MNRLKNINKLSSTISIGIGVILSQQCTFFIDKYKFPFWVNPIIALVVVAVTFPFIRFLFEVIFESSKILRKLLLGNQFVEGTWLDLMSIDGVKYSYGVSQIKASSSSLRFSGEDFDLEGNHQGHYLAQQIALDWPKMKYKHTYHRSDNPTSIEGYGELQFIEREGYPIRYVGFVLNFFDEKRRYDKRIVSSRLRILYYGYGVDRL